MKKIVLVFCVVASLFLLVACNGMGKTDYKVEVEQFANRFAKLVADSTIDSIRAMYPALDTMSVQFVTPSGNAFAQEDENTPGTFNVKFGDVTLKVFRAIDGSFSIIESHGLFFYNPEKFELAKKTGQWVNSMPDIELFKRMNDVGFDKFMESKMHPSTDGLKIVSKKGYDYNEVEGGAMEPAGLIVTVKNTGDVQVPGDAYSVVFTAHDFDWDLTKDVYDHKSKAGVDLAPGEQAEFSHSFKYVEFGVSVKIKTSSKGSKISSRDYQATGNEYQEYLNSKK